MIIVSIKTENDTNANNRYCLTIIRDISVIDCIISSLFNFIAIRMAPTTRTVVKTQGSSGSSQYGATKATGIELFVL